MQNPHYDPEFATGAMVLTALYGDSRWGRDAQNCAKTTSLSAGICRVFTLTFDYKHAVKSSKIRAPPVLFTPQPPAGLGINMPYTTSGSLQPWLGPAALIQVRRAV